MCYNNYDNIVKDLIVSFIILLLFRCDNSKYITCSAKIENNEERKGILK